MISHDFSDDVQHFGNLLSLNHQGTNDAVGKQCNSYMSSFLRNHCQIPVTYAGQRVESNKIPSRYHTASLLNQAHEPGGKEELSQKQIILPD
jgi:hypothetical protein